MQDVIHSLVNQSSLLKAAPYSFGIQAIQTQ